MEEMELWRVSVEEADIPQEDQMLERLLEQEFSQELEKMLQTLKPLDRQLFLKLYVEEKSVRQVSREMGMEASVIYNRISRGKRKLRKKFTVERGV